MDFVIFKNPHLRYRKEDFGGVAKLQLKTFILNKNQYKLISTLNQFLVYRSLENKDKLLVDKLIKDNLLVRLAMKEAKKLGFRE